MEATAGGATASPTSLSAPTSVKIPIHALGNSKVGPKNGRDYGTDYNADADHSRGSGSSGSGSGGGGGGGGSGGGGGGGGGCSESWESFTTIWLQECRKEESFESRSVLEVRTLDTTDGYGPIDFTPSEASGREREAAASAGPVSGPTSPAKSNL